MPELDYTKMGLEELARLLAGVPAESQRAAGLSAEFTRRQTLAVIDAAEAQSRAAKAAEDSANYLWYSVAVLAGSSVATLLVSIANLIVSIRH